MRKTTPPRERFTTFYFVDRSSGCWLWIGGTNGRYPLFGISRRTRVYAHRFSYEEFVGPIPSGLEIDHLCSNIKCVNPDHLQPVTHQENQRRYADSTVKCRHGHPY